VQQGDTLFELALAAGLRTEVLRQGNCLQGSQINTGQVLLVPPQSVVVQVAPPVGCDFPTVQVTEPRPGNILRGKFTMRGLADHPNFGFYDLQVRSADGPPEFQTAYRSSERVTAEGDLGSIEIGSDYPPGLYWIRVMVYNRDSYEEAYCAIQVRFARP
jgi:LysM repeat protein